MSLVRFEVYNQGALVGTTELQSVSLTAAEAQQALLVEDNSCSAKLVAAGSSVHLLGATHLDPCQLYALQLTRRSGALS